MSFLAKIAEYLRVRRNLILGSAVRQIQDSPLFDADYYVSSNPDVRNAGMDPAKHYLFHGWREHRNPSASFSTSQYLFDNPDLAREIEIEIRRDAGLPEMRPKEEGETALAAAR